MSSTSTSVIANIPADDHSNQQIHRLQALAACTWLQMSLSFVANAVAWACVLASSFLRALFI